MATQMSSGKGTQAIVLRDGSTAYVRELGPEDDRSLTVFVGQLSEDAIYYRFLTSGISKEAVFSELSPKLGSYVLAAFKEGAVIGIASYTSSGPEAAEVGLLVLDAFQKMGVGTALTEMVARAANRRGVSVFEAIIDWSNTKMIELVRNLGFPTSEKVEPEYIRMRFPTSIDPVTIAEFQERWAFGPDP
jgi:GNAT superfamily N-acetyltransferase